MGGRAWGKAYADDRSDDSTENVQELDRIWLGFMTARVMLSLMLLLLQLIFLYWGSYRINPLLVMLCGAYFMAALAMRLLAAPGLLGNVVDRRWIGTVGLDLLVFAALQIVQGNNINYTPLFALPILMASVLGSLLLALGSAATVTLFLLAQAAWIVTQAPWETAAHFMQAALTGTGCFSIAFLANQISSRLASQEQRAQYSHLEARVQTLVNELVIESLADGILVIDPLGKVRASNPAARELLGTVRLLPGATGLLSAIGEWPSLVELVECSFNTNAPAQAEIILGHAGQGTRRVQVRTQVTATQAGDAGRLCVMFLKDQREVEARMRRDKLASMARMSVAVAHEIRNPLAAISQANALLDEDIQEPRHRQLTQMVRQNARRLEKIVDEILNVSRLQSTSQRPPMYIPLAQSIRGIHEEFKTQPYAGHPIHLELSGGERTVAFEHEHLRQILVNLLDNARRYASHEAASIQIHAGVRSNGQTTLSVWSDGRPIDQSMEAHLFEPFFSSESRSSGLGLYICRELCEGHGASITYSRGWRSLGGVSTEGNEFTISFRPQAAALTADPLPH